MSQTNFVSENIFKRVFRILVNNSDGTGFVVESESREGKFLVTAKHMFKSIGYPQKAVIKIQYQNIWQEENVEVFYHENPDIDVAVIKTEYFNSMSFGKVNYDSNKALVSQEVFMLGFPYGISTDLYERNNGYPVALVKKGCISGMAMQERFFWVDWDNNQGFSGGPLVYRVYKKDEYSDEEYVAGVTRGYCPHRIKVYSEDGTETSMYAEENSGLGISYRIETAFEIIDKI